MLKQVKPVERPWVAILDHSIDIGTKKAFVVLRVTLDSLIKKGKAIGLNECKCIGLSVTEKVNGETIAGQLEEIFALSGRPTAIIKDCEYTLGKGVRLYSEKQNITVPVIDDIGHVMATALKTQYSDSKGYKDFTELTSKGANRLRQTNLAYLTPPKLRTKGRFQSISKLGTWGDKRLNILAVKGAAKKSSVTGETTQCIAWF